MPFHFGLRSVGALGGAYAAVFVPISATGGDEVDDVTIGGVLFRVHQFTTTGSSSFVVSSLGDSDGEVEFLVVAGGGGGGGNDSSGWAAGGGGAGGYRTGNLTVTADTFPTVVGSGGTGGAVNTNGGKGGNSTFSTFTSTGGGGGGRSTGAGTGVSGLPGGSGGGGAGFSGSTTAGGAGNEGSFTPPEGNNGGPSTLNTNNPGGGGGAGGVGPGGTASGQPTSGGLGVANDITGTSVTYAAGGGAQQTAPVTSPANSGRGGDALNGTSAVGRAGGSGIVIIRYPLQAAA